MNKTLMVNLNAMKARVEELEKSIQAKEDEMNRRKETFEQDLKRASNANDEFKTKEEEFREATRRQAAELQTKLLALQDELILKEKAYRDELAELDRNTRHLSLEKENVAAQLETAKSELIKLTCNDGGGDVSANINTKSL